MTRCDDVRRAISARMDETELDAHVLTESVAVDRHLMSCSSCAEFEQIALGTRRALRFEDAEGPAAHDIEMTDTMLASIVARAADADVAVTSAHAQRNRWSLVAAVAIFLAGLAAGAVAMRWDGGVPTAVASDRAGLVAEGQTRVERLRAAITVVERGADETTQRADGALTYVAPEAVHLALRSSAGGDRTTEVGVNGETAWMIEGAATSVVTGREPFDPSGWSALELIVPVDAFGRDPAAIIETDVDGRAAVLVTTTVAQVEELLDAVRTGSSWRPLHPSDTVVMWLDPSTAVPLRVEVAASLDPDRAAWAARQGLREPVDGPLFVVELHDVVVNAGDVAVPALPPGGARASLGFVDRAVAPSEVPVPSWLPEAMVEHRSGERRTPGSDRLVVVRTWTTGRSWVKVTATRSWSVDRLFGDIGRLVRPVETDAGVLYVSEDGSAVALHGDGIDLVVTGSVTEAELQRVAASLGVAGRAIPAWWDEAGARTLDELSRAGVAVLAPVAGDSDGASIAYAVDGARVEVSVTGPGARGVRITQRPALVLTPGEDPDAMAVTVRGREGRYSPSFGELAWIEREQLVVLSTRTLTVGELTVFAEDLRWFD